MTNLRPINVGVGRERGKRGRRERVVTKGLKEIMSKQELLFNNLHVSSDFRFQSTILHSHICCLILSLEKHFEVSCGVKEPPNSIEVTASLLFRAQSYICITHAHEGTPSFSFHWLWILVFWPKWKKRMTNSSDLVSQEQLSWFKKILLIKKFK